MPTPPIAEDPARGPIGRLPAVSVKFPSDLRLAILAALMARVGYRIKWVRRGKANKVQDGRV